MDRQFDPYDEQHVFMYHPPKHGDTERRQRVRDKAKEFALLLRDLCPYSRELSLARTSLEECVTWANASIDRNAQMGDYGHTPGRDEADPEWRRWATASADGQTLELQPGDPMQREIAGGVEVSLGLGDRWRGHNQLIPRDEALPALPPIQTHPGGEAQVDRRGEYEYTDREGVRRGADGRRRPAGVKELETVEDLAEAAEPNEPRE